MCESLGAVTRRERELAPLPLVPRSIIDRVKSLPSRVPVCDATSQVKRKFNETSPRGISRLATTKDAIYTSKKRNGTYREKVRCIRSSPRRSPPFLAVKYTCLIFSRAKRYLVPPVTFVRASRSRRPLFPKLNTRDRRADLFAPPRFTKRARREAQREALTERHPKGGIPDFVRRSRSIAGRTDARRQHHRGCPGRRFGCPAPSVGVRTHARLTVPRSKYI